MHLLRVKLWCSKCGGANGRAGETLLVRKVRQKVVKIRSQGVKRHSYF